MHYSEDMAGGNANSPESGSLSRTRQQVRPVSPGFFKSSGASPLRHFRVISSNEHFRNFPAPVFRRARVMRKIQQNVIRNGCFGFLAATRIYRLYRLQL